MPLSLAREEWRGCSKVFINRKKSGMKPLQDLSEDFSTGSVERAVLRYLYEDREREASSLRYEIIRVDRFASPCASEAGTIYAVVVKELVTLPVAQKEERTRWVVLLATSQEEGSLKISAPIMSAHLGSL